MPRIAWIIGTWILILLSSCKHRTSNVVYSVTNKSGAEINDVAISIGSEYRFEHGVLIPDAPSAVLDQIKLSDSNLVAITWQTASGGKGNASINIDRDKLTRDRGIEFTIKDDGTISTGFHYPEGF